MSIIVIFIATAIAAFILSKAAGKIGLLAHPDEFRRHEKVTPLLGGIAIFIGLCLGVILINSDYANLMPALALLCLLGVIDDRIQLASWTRFLVQAIAVYLMIMLTDVKLTHLGGLVSEQNLYVGMWSIPLTIFAAIGVINAVNMSDGMDGLAGSLVMLVLLALLFSQPNEHYLLKVAIASVAAFLLFNARIFKTPARIFMGDAGSTMLGLLLAYLLIKTTQLPDQYLSPVTALWFLALPLIDAVAVLLARPLQGKSPFEADRSHYHHRLLDKGLSVNQTLLCVLLIQLGFILIGLIFLHFGIVDRIQFVSFLLLFFIYLIGLIITNKRTTVAGG